MQTIQLWQNENFSYENFVLNLEEEKVEMQNWILFQTVTNSYGELGSQPHKKLKNKENLIHAVEFSFDQIEIFLIKSSSSE